MALGPGVARRLHYQTIASTNEQALSLAREGEVGPLWITADVQSAGRGRRSRAWVSELGNLYASLLLTDVGPAARAPELSFVAGLAVLDAILSLAPELAARLRLKWPNDVLLDGRKLAGILIESELGPRGLVVVIGSGVNCRTHPTDTEFPAIDLREAGCDLAPLGLFDALSAAMQARLEAWSRGDGFPAIREDWLAHAAGLGELLIARTGRSIVEGRFRGIDGSGALVIALPGGALQTISAGEIFPVSAASQ